MEEVSGVYVQFVENKFQVEIPKLSEMLSCGTAQVTCICSGQTEICKLRYGGGGGGWRYACVQAILRHLGGGECMCSGYTETCTMEVLGTCMCLDYTEACIRGGGGLRQMHVFRLC